MKSAALLIVLLLIAVVGCQSTEPAKITVVDDASRAIYFEGTPERVVSLSPAATEILYSLGLEDKIVGVTEADDYPEEAKDKPKVGGYSTTSVEAVVEKNPDLVLTNSDDEVAHRLLDLGVPVIVLQPRDIYGVFRNIQVTGQVMGRTDEADILVSELRERLDAVTGVTARSPSRPTIFYELDGSDPEAPWTTGPGTFVNDLISLAGGSNVVSSGPQWAQLSMEVLLELDPDIIILGDYPWVTPEDVQDRGPVWQKLKAVETGRVRPLSDSALTSRPGPRIIDGLEELARHIHPELFPDAGGGSR